MKLSDWARANGISYKTAWLWWKQDKLPVPARQTPTGTILVDVPERKDVGAVLYARVSSADQRSDFCARLDGRRSARRRAERAVACATEADPS